MKRFCLFLLAIFFCCGAVQAADWNAWKVIGGQTSIQAGILQVKTSLQPCYIVSPLLGANADTKDTVTLKIKSSLTGMASLHWTNSYSREFDMVKVVPFRLNASHRFETYYINVKAQSASWIGFTQQLLVSLPNSRGEVEIEELTLSEGNFGTNLISGWQEFWSPKGRDEIGTTINNIKSSSLLGISINQYLYVIILIGMVFLALYEFRQGFSAKKYSIFCLKAWALMFFFWLLLDANSIFNEVGRFSQDLQRYGGRSLDAKRSVIVPEMQELYPFIKFCNEKLPARVPVKCANDFAGGFTGLFVNYYLYPHVLSEDARYLLVFRPSTAISVPGTKLFAKFKEDQYILRR